MPDHEYPIIHKLTYEPSAQVCSRQGIEIYVGTDKPTERHSDIHSDS